jgi:hypothetical protein
MTNTFEQVDELQADALNLVVSQTGSGQNGRVLIPASAQGREDAKEIDSGELPVVDAVRAAIKLANEMKLAVVVIDKDKIWRAKWGTLYRDSGDGEPPQSAN